MTDHGMVRSEYQFQKSYMNIPRTTFHLTLNNFGIVFENVSGNRI
jgi:hypothetical protein